MRAYIAETSTKMTAKAMPKVERTTIAGSIEIPRILNGLWQLAGGHDQDINVAVAADAMKPLYEILATVSKHP